MTKTCPECGESALFHYQFCGRCGYVFIDVEAPVLEDTAPQIANLFSTVDVVGNPIGPVDLNKLAALAQIGMILPNAEVVALDNGKVFAAAEHPYLRQAFGTQVQASPQPPREASASMVSSPVQARRRMTAWDWTTIAFIVFCLLMALGRPLGK